MSPIDWTQELQLHNVKELYVEFSMKVGGDIGWIMAYPYKRH